MNMHNTTLLSTVISLVLLAGCNGSSSDADGQTTEIDSKLALLAEEQGLIGDPLEDITAPSINSKIAQLGKKLFYTKSLGGQGDTACVSCHHPMLGGGDDFALSIGVDALDEEVLGPGRLKDVDNDGVADYNPPLVPRNAPSVFNLALWKKTFFWDGRVQVLNGDEVELGALPIISTPDSGYGIADLNAGDHLAIAQSKFPITAAHEMLGSFATTVKNATEDYPEKEDDPTGGIVRNLQRDALADRLCGKPIDGDTVQIDVNNWIDEFQNVFESDEGAEMLITQDTIALAIGAYERSMIFIDNPWFAYLNGDTEALTDEQKAGAELFFTARADGGAGCSSCHSGYMLSDEEHHLDGFPQIGHGKGDGLPDGTDSYDTSDDYGRERVTGDLDDRYKFRTPLLLNVEVTGPYGHAGSLETLEQVVRFSLNPRAEVDNYFDTHAWCDMAYFSELDNCTELYPDAKQYTLQAISKREVLEKAEGLPPAPDFTDEQVAQLVAFLEALTDPCVKDRECMRPWIFEPGESEPDSNMLYATDVAGADL